MAIMTFAVPIGIWLSISLAVYTFLWTGFIHRFGILAISLFNFGLSVMLSPGLLIGGHGALPFPGGAAVLIGATGSEAFPSFNFMLWMLTFLIFSVFSWTLKKSDTND